MAGVHQIRWRIGLAIAAISLIPATLSITEADALLQFKNNLKNTDALSTWVSGTKPCDRGTALWYGLECSDDAVSGLRLDSLGLEGTINVNALSEVIGLGTLSLENNSFTGTLPAMKRMKGLKEIRISNNKFSGEIPGGYFVGMLSLRTVRLADNEFRGEIPWSLGTVTHLEELELQNNLFVGRIPELPQKTLASFNVSNNKLSGEIPDGLQRFNSDSFSGNEDVCGMNLRKPCKGGKLDKRRKAIDEMIERAIMMGGAGLLSLILLALIMIKSEESKTTFNFIDKSVTTQLKSQTGSGTLDETHRNGFNESGKRSDSVKISDLVMVNEDKGVFGLSDLMKAGAESLGDGKDSGFGMSYKAAMISGLTVVVKRMKDCNRVGKDGFEMEMRKLGRVKHPNLLPPLAYHYRRDEKLLITEFIPAGSLFYLLHGDPKIRKELSWAVRLIIIKGIAKGLEYLHTFFPTAALPHGNLKSSNVLISSNCEPLLSEFSLDPVVNTNQAADLLFAYKAPEAANYGIISPKCDVFCLGIVILEILTGKFPFQYVPDGTRGVDVVGWVEMCITQGRVSEVFDRDLMMNVTSPSSRLEMEKLLYIGADCAERNPDLRLTLEEAVNRIEQIRYGGSHDYQPRYSSDSGQPLSLSSSFNSFGSQSQNYENINNNLSWRIRYDGNSSQSVRTSYENLMMHNMADIAGGNYSGRRPGKQKVQTLDKCINLSSKLKQDGYAAKQGMDQQKEKPIKAFAQGNAHHNAFGLLDDLG